MYSGISGQELRVDIYIGLVYYQRLRHMVSDKFQVRTTGPVHNLTQQPVKEGNVPVVFDWVKWNVIPYWLMVSFRPQDRLMNCSDYSKAHLYHVRIILSPIPVPWSKAPPPIPQFTVKVVPKIKEKLNETVAIPSSSVTLPVNLWP